MKTLLFKGVIFTFIILINYQTIDAQKIHENPKFGPDSAARMECAKNLSLYREYVKQKNYVDAYNPWFKVFYACPKASKNIYIDGVKIIKYQIVIKTIEIPCGIMSC